jgi:photosystem II stability/assembly factor-like uncharacterized protein
MRIHTVRNLFSILCILLLSLSTASAQSGWYWSHPRVRVYSMSFVSFADANNGWGGSLSHTDDGGLTWAGQSLSQSSMYISAGVRGLCAIDALNCTAVGFAGYGHTWWGVIDRTTDGGKTWFEQRGNPRDYEFEAVAFANRTSGIVVGRGGIVMYTQDGGHNWTGSNSSTYVNLHGVSCPDSSTGIAVGDGGTIILSTNGGASWIVQSSNASYQLRGVSARGMTAVAVGGSGTILRSTDNGATWTTQMSGTSSALMAVVLTDELHGIAVGQHGVILRTTDAGVTWQPQVSQTSFDLYGVSFPDPLTGIAVGPGSGPYGGGVIVRTNDGGKTWTLLTSVTQDQLQGVSFTDFNTGTAVGYTDIVRTTDAGLTWRLQERPTSKWLHNVSFVNTNLGLAVGDSGAIIRTTNGGTVWTVQQSPTQSDLYGISFIDSNTATVVGWNSTTGRNHAIVHTTNGGTTWILQQCPGLSEFAALYSVSFSDAMTGIAVGVDTSGLIIKTTNGGATWNVQAKIPGKSLSGAKLINGATGTVVGSHGTILRTTDGGQHWKFQDCPVVTDLFSVDFIDRWHGTIAGGFGTILRTDDGGDHWESQTTLATWDLRGVSLTDKLTGTVVGGTGTIFRTTDGGGGTVDTTDPPPPASGETGVLSASATALPANGVSTSIITLHATDAFGHAVTTGGAPVSLVPFPSTAKLSGATDHGDGTYTWVLTAGSSPDTVTMTGTINGNAIPGAVKVAFTNPTDFFLEQNFPNPFNTSTVIVYGLPQDQHVTVSVYNVLGQRVAVLTDADVKAGHHSLTFDGSGFASGLYIYRLQTAAFTKTFKMQLLK